MGRARGPLEAVARGLLDGGGEAGAVGGLFTLVLFTRTAYAKKAGKIKWLPVLPIVRKS